jgi:hypothetical protein
MISKKTKLYFELTICEKYRGKNTGPQCVKNTTKYVVRKRETRFLFRLLVWERILSFRCKLCLLCCVGLLSSYIVVRHDDSVTDANKGY